jgi:hypothetical protein
MSTSSPINLSQRAMASPFLVYGTLPGTESITDSHGAHARRTAHLPRQGPEGHRPGKRALHRARAGARSPLDGGRSGRGIPEPARVPEDGDRLDRHRGRRAHALGARHVVRGRAARSPPVGHDPRAGLEQRLRRRARSRPTPTPGSPSISGSPAAWCTCPSPRAAPRTPSTAGDGKLVGFADGYAYLATTALRSTTSTPGSPGAARAPSP